jgi:transglutaminase-like putative cysteine protease
MQYRVKHNTTYAYGDTVSICYNELYLRPRHLPGQSLQQYDLQVHPAPATVTQRIDYFGNDVAFMVIQEPHRTLSITVQSTVEVTASAPSPTTATPAWEAVRAHLQHDRSAAVMAAYQFVFDSPHVVVWPAIRRFAAPSFTAGRPLLDAVQSLTERIYRTFTYDPTATSISTPLHDAFRQRRGVCQDFAHLAIACLRSQGLAARYVSGYLVTQPPPGQSRLRGADASHAWLAVYCPELGWIDVDPTNNVFPGSGHIRVAFGRDYSDVSPIKGVVLGGGEHTLQVAVDVVPSSAHALRL